MTPDATRSSGMPRALAEPLHALGEQRLQESARRRPHGAPACGAWRSRTRRIQSTASRPGVEPDADASRSRLDVGAGRPAPGAPPPVGAVGHGDEAGLAEGLAELAVDLPGLAEGAAACAGTASRPAPANCGSGRYSSANCGMLPVRLVSTPTRPPGRSDAADAAAAPSPSPRRPARSAGRRRRSCSALRLRDELLRPRVHERRRSTPSSSARSRAAASMPSE